MTEQDLNTLRELAEYFEKEDGQINYLLSDSTTYTSEQYDYLELELKQKLDETILEFKNKYIVLPTFKVKDNENIEVSLACNRNLINISTIYKRMLEHQNDHQKNSF